MATFYLTRISHRLSEILVHQATLLEHIVTDQRYYSDYFRVAFYGNFPVALRNKQFIVRTAPFPFALLNSDSRSIEGTSGRSSGRSVNEC